MPPTRRTQAERSEATREKLLTAAVEALAELGYARTSTTEIARRAGVSRGAQLHHFPTKAALVTAASHHVLDRRMEEFRATMGALPSGPERFGHAIDLLWGMMQAPSMVAWFELLTAARTDAELRAEVAALTDHHQEVVQVLWRELFPGGIGGLDDDENAVVPKVLFAVLDGLWVQQLAGGASAPATVDAVLTSLKDLAALLDALPGLLPDGLPELRAARTARRTTDDPDVVPDAKPER